MKIRGRMEEWNDGRMVKYQPSKLPVFQTSTAFTLIERVPSNNENTRRMKGTAPVSFPIQTGSLTAERTRSAVTKSPDGKPSIEGRLQASPSGEANKQAVGRRTATSIVKSTTAVITGRAVEDRAASPCSMGEACYSRGSEMGATREARRCKRRRHARKVDSSNWGGPARFRVNRGKTIKRVDPLPQPRATTVTSPYRSGSSRCQRIRGGIRSKAESRRDAVPGVGDARSSEDHGDSKTLWERRGISLKKTSREERSG